MKEENKARMPTASDDEFLSEAVADDAEDLVYRWAKGLPLHVQAALTMLLQDRRKLAARPQFIDMGAPALPELKIGINNVPLCTHEKGAGSIACSACHRNLIFQEGWDQSLEEVVRDLRDRARLSVGPLKETLFAYATRFELHEHIKK